MYYINGEYTDNYIETKGMLYGYGCFETIMVRDKKAVFLKEHLLRLKNSLSLIHIESKIDFENVIEKLIEYENMGDNDEGSLRITVTDADVLVSLKKIKLREAAGGVRAGLIKKYFQNEMGFIKSISYIGNILARKELEENNLYEGVFLNRLGDLTEGTVSNLFCIKGETVYTPPLALNILKGITREKIILLLKKNGIHIEEKVFGVSFLLESDGIFFTNSLMKYGLIWVNDFEGKKFHKPEILNKIEKEYLKLQKSVV